MNGSRGTQPIRTKVPRQCAPRARRRGEPPSDPYLTQRPPQEGARCRQCGAVYQRKRWRLAPLAVLPARGRGGAPLVLCPACRKTQDHYPNGVVTVHWPKNPAVREEMLHLIRHQEQQGRRINPLERILSLDATADTLTVMTTNERLAGRIGRALERAFHGKTVYQWSRENKLVRVEWAGVPAGAAARGTRAARNRKGGR